MAERLLGHVTHWYGGIGVAGIHIDSGELSVGDRIHVLGHTTDFEQTVESIQLDHEAVQTAHNGEDVGIKTSDHVREHDAVYVVQ